MFCPSCGTKLRDDSRFCFSCGVQTNSVPVIPKRPFQKVIASKKLDTVSALIIIVSVVMLLASLILPLFELGGQNNQTSPFNYTLSLFGDNYMANFGCQDEIVSTMETSLIFSIAAIIAVNIFSVLKKHVIQALFALINTIIIFICHGKISSIWGSKTRYITWTDSKIGFNVLIVGSFVVLALSIFIASKTLEQTKTSPLPKPSNPSATHIDITPSLSLAQPANHSWLCSCGATNESSMKHCPKCGSSRAEFAGATPWICSNCGTENPAEYAFCIKCKKACRSKNDDLF